MAAIAVEICDDRATVPRRQVPGEQRQPVGCAERDLAHAKSSQIAELRVPRIGKIEQLPLKDVKAPDHHAILRERGPEMHVHHARAPKTMKWRRSTVRPLGVLAP